MAPDAIKPKGTLKDPSKGNEASSNFEIILATLRISTKDNPKGKGPASTTTSVTKPNKPSAKDNPPFKIN